MSALIQAEEKREPMPVVRADLAALDRLEGEAIAVFCFSDVRPLCGAAGFLDWRMCGGLSQTLESGQFVGSRGESMLVPCRGRLRVRRVFAFGLGPRGEWTEGGLREAVRMAVQTLSRAGVTRLVLGAPAAKRQPEIERAFVKVVSEELRSTPVQLLVEQVG